MSSFLYIFILYFVYHLSSFPINFSTIPNKNNPIPAQRYKKEAIIVGSTKFNKSFESGTFIAYSRPENNWPRHLFFLNAHILHI